MSLFKSNSIEKQKELSKYKTKKELADSLHSLRFTIGLKIPKPVKTVLKWMAEMNGKAKASNGLGAFYHSEQRIADEIGCSLSTVERAFKWLKRHGLMITYQSWNYAEDKGGSAYKVLSDARTVKIIVDALIKQDDEIIKKIVITAEKETSEIVKKLTGTIEEKANKNIDELAGTGEENGSQIDRKLTGTMTGTMTGNKRPLEKTSIEKDLSTNNRSPMPDVKIDFETVQLLNSYKNFSKNGRWTTEEKEYLTHWIQAGINEAEADLSLNVDANCIKKAIGQVVTRYSHKKPLIEIGRILKQSIINELEQSEFRETLAQMKATREETGATLEQPKKSYGKKPIRTELVPNWFDDSTKEIQNKLNGQQTATNDFNSVNAKFNSMGIKLKAPQSHSEAVQSI